MVIVLAETSSPVLRDAGNFRALMVEAQAAREKYVADDLATLGTRDGDHVWLSIAALKALGPDEQPWRDGFDAMIAYAAKAGWVSDERAAVRAHIEWSGA